MFSSCHGSLLVKFRQTTVRPASQTEALLMISARALDLLRRWGPGSGGEDGGASAATGKGGRRTGHGGSAVTEQGRRGARLVSGQAREDAASPQSSSRPLENYILYSFLPVLCINQWTWRE